MNSTGVKRRHFPGGKAVQPVKRGPFRGSPISSGSTKPLRGHGAVKQILSLGSAQSVSVSLTFPLLTLAISSNSEGKGLGVCHPDGGTAFYPNVDQGLSELRARYGESLEDVTVVMPDALLYGTLFFHECGQKVSHPVCLSALSRAVHSPGQDTGLDSLARLYGLSDWRGSAAGVQDDPAARRHQEVASESLRSEAALTWQIFRVMLPELTPRDTELEAISHTIRLFLERPFTVDIDQLNHAAEVVEREMATSLKAVDATRDKISGNDSFVSLLEQALSVTGRLVPVKEKSGRSVPALSRKDPAFAILLDDDDPRVRALARAHVVVKAAPDLESRIRFLRDRSGEYDGRAHLRLVYHKAIHGRFAGGGGFSIHNLRKPGRGGQQPLDEAALAIRCSLKCPYPGHVLVAADACQIEARVLAWLAGEEALSAAFAQGRDVYSEFASHVFGRPVYKASDSDPDHDLLSTLRWVGKQAVLGLGYGMGADTFKERLLITPEGRNLFKQGLLDTDKCREIVCTYRERYGKVVQLWDELEAGFRHCVMYGQEVRVGRLLIKGSGGTMKLVLPSGRPIVYPDCRITNTDELCYGHDGSTLYAALLAEHAASGTARDLLVDCVLRLEEAGRPVLTHIHDEIICTAPEAEAETCAGSMEEVWRKVPGWAEGLVLKAETRIGSSLGDLE